MTKTEQIREEWEKSEEAEYMESDTSIRIIGNWWLQKLAEQREDYKKTLNSGRKMYQQGREDEKKEIIDWCKKRCQDNIRINGTDKWNGDMEELIEVLKKCQL